MEEKFWRRVIKGSDQDSCWAWTGAKLPAGYGFITKYKKVNGVWKRSTAYAHRLSYEIHEGPIPEGLKVLHSCDTPSCTNPNHLWAGTQQDNVDDMLKKGRHPNIPQTVRNEMLPLHFRLRLEREKKARQSAQRR